VVYIRGFETICRLKIIGCCNLRSVSHIAYYNSKTRP